VYNKLLKKHGIILSIVIVSFAINLLGIRWGVPNYCRTELALGDKLKTGQFYKILADTRNEIYVKTGQNTAAYAGMLREKGMSYKEMVNRSTPGRKNGTIMLKSNKIIPKEILHAINSYLVRSKQGDEQNMLSAIAKMRPKKLDFNPHFFIPGGSYVYLLAGWFYLADKVGYLNITPDLTFYHTHPEEMAKFYILGRMISGISTAFLVLIIYLIARKLYDKNTALVSALFSAIIPMTFIEANVMKQHSYASFWSLLSIYFMIKIYMSDKRKYYLYSGIALGLAASAAFNTWVYLCFLPVVLFFRSIPGRQLNNLFTITRQTIYVFIISLLVFIITNPYLFVSFQEFIYEMKWIGGHHSFVLTPWNFLYIPLRESLGSLLWIILFASIIYAFIKKEKCDIMLLSFLLPLLIFIAFATGYQGQYAGYMRYYLPLLLLLLIFPARSIVDIYKRVGKFGKPAVLILVSIVIIYTVSLRISYIVWLSRDNEKQSESVKAGKWINENIPKDSSIGILKYTPHVDIDPPFRFTDYRIISNFEPIESFSRVDELPEYFVIGETPEMIITKKLVPTKDFANFYKLIKHFKHEIKLGPFQFHNVLSPADLTVSIYKNIK